MSLCFVLFQSRSLTVGAVGFIPERLMVNNTNYYNEIGQSVLTLVHPYRARIRGGWCWRDCGE